MGAGHRCVLAAVAFVIAQGCSGHPPEDRGMCAVTEPRTDVLVSSLNVVDLLFVVDSSLSMADEQARLAEQLPRLARVMLEGEIVDPDTGTMRSLPRRRDLHLGVVTTDLGCSASDAGDDGLLRRSGDGAGECASSYPAFVSWAPRDAVEPAQTHFECVAEPGAGGCGYEQPLEAALKTLHPAEPEPTGAFDGTFRVGTAHGDAGNAGFLREDSLLSIVVVTDEDDCSVRDPALFDETGGLSATEDDPSCHARSDALLPLDRFVDGLLALRPDNPDLLALQIVAGIPPDLLPDRARSRVEEVLADPRMQPSARETDPDRLQPSCTSSEGTSSAFPPRRLVRLAGELKRNNANAGFASICEPSWLEALTPTLDKLAEVLAGTCLPRALEVGDDGRVDCRLVETLPADAESTRCADIPGREPFDPPRHDADTGSERCIVTQRVPDRETSAIPDAPGWYYDDFSLEVREECGEDGQDVRYALGAEPAWGTRVLLSCAMVRPLAAPAGNVVGGACDATPGCPDEPDAPGTTFCHFGTCQRYCERDADCPATQRCLRWPGGYEPSICGHPSCGRGVSTGAHVVGRACEPRWVPAGGFNRAEVYAETGHPGCSGGACVVYRLGGDPRNLVSEGCPRETHACVCEEQVARRVACSCRCNGPAGTGPFCACPEGTHCVPVVGAGSGHAASYCVSIEAMCCTGRLDPARCEDVTC